jgi:hypothetical protein
MFAKNEATWDRALRAVIGIVVLSLIFWGPKSLWGLLGLIPLFTAFAGWCPLYAALGLSTIPKAEPAEAA